MLRIAMRSKMEACRLGSRTGSAPRELHALRPLLLFHICASASSSVFQGAGYFQMQLDRHQITLLVGMRTSSIILCSNLAMCVKSLRNVQTLWPSNSTSENPKEIILNKEKALCAWTFISALLTTLKYWKWANVQEQENGWTVIR